MAHPAKKTFTGKLNCLQQKWQEHTLCENHALVFKMPTGTYHRAIERSFDYPDIDAPVDCDACSESLMRIVGVL